MMLKSVIGKGKKADVAITLLVFMTLAACGIALFIFLTKSGQIQTAVTDLSAFPSLSAEEEIYIFTIKGLFEKLSSSDPGKEFMRAYIVSANFDNGLLHKYTPSMRDSLGNPETRIVAENNIVTVSLKNFKFFQPGNLNLVHYRDIYFEIPLKTSKT